MQNFSHVPKTLTVSPNQSFLEGSQQTREAVVGQVVVRNCYLGSEFSRPVGLLLLLTASHRLLFTTAVNELLSGGCSSSLSSMLDTPLIGVFIIEKELNYRSSGQANNAISPKRNVFSEVHTTHIFKSLQETAYCLRYDRLAKSK